MRLNVPFIPDDDYVRFLAGLGDALEAVHYSLYDSVVSDARIRLQAVPEQRLAFRLRRLPGVRKYLLANGRFHAPERYRTPEGLAALVRRLDRLKTVGVIDGLIFSDPYLLTAVSDAAPELAAGIEAIPSINFMIDTTPKLVTVMEMIGNTRFRLPGKILLDRSLNRRPTALRYLSAEIRRRWPQIQVELLVNEGCLPACPYRSTHEALIAAVNTGAVIDTYGINRDLGCIRHLFRTPHRILASPFIRPEDMHRYAKWVDVFKICGRTLGPDYLQRTVAAYITGAYDGNLLDLLDAANWMADRWLLDNRKLSPPMVDRLMSCGNDCSGCGHCRQWFQRCARPQPLKIDAYAAR